MRFAVRLLCLALLPLTIACNGKGSSPTGPSPSSAPPATTRIINVSGSLAFGDVAVGSQRDLSFTIANTGTSTLNVSGLSVTGGLAAHTTASWTNGPIGAGASQAVTVRFQPTTAGSYSGTITVSADHTSGANTIAITGNATGASAQGVWSGRYEVLRCDGTGSNQDYFCSQRGAYPPGSSLPLTLNLSQSGTSVSGSIAFGQVTGNVRGSMDGGGNLTLEGTASSGQISLALTSFTVSVSGSSMTGNLTYGAGLAGVPGVAVVTSRLSGMTRR